MPAFTRILVAVDGSLLAEHASEVAVELAKDIQADLAFVYVIDPREAVAPEGGIPGPTLLEMARSEGRGILTRTAAGAGLAAPPEQFLREGSATTEIVAAAQEWGANLIVVGSHGRAGIGRTLMGSTSDGVVRHASCPVLVVRKQPDRKA